MIGDGRFYAQLSSAEDILKRGRLFEERQAFPKKDLGTSFFRGKSYREVYDNCLREFAYDFRLVDQSLLLFVKGGRDEHDGSLNFCYYESPLAVISYEQFVALEFGVSPFDESYDETIGLWGDELRPEYEQSLNSSDSRIAVTPLRYDYKSTDYSPGVHPVSHIHVGFQSEIRIQTDRVLNPISFVLFIVRQCYPEAWRKLLQMEESPIWCRNVRDEIEAVHAMYHSEIDERELILR